MNYSQSSEFIKEFKRLNKKWRSLPDDLDRVRILINRLYLDEKSLETIEFRQSFFATNKGAILKLSDDGKEVVKMRLDCDSLNGSDKVRIVFIAIRSQDEVHFIEIYAKNEKLREDQKRIKKYLVSK